MPIGVTPQSAARIRRAVEYVEGQGRQGGVAPTSVQSAVEIHLVKPDDPLELVAGRYRAKRFDYDAQNKVKTEAEACWLDTSINDEEPDPEIYYWCKLVGERVADDLSVYAPVGAVATATAYRYYCIDGALQEFEVQPGGSLTYIRDVSCCSTDCEEVEECVNECDATDVAATLCVHLTEDGGPEWGGGWVDGTFIEVTETSPDAVWSGSGPTNDGEGTITITITATGDGTSTSDGGSPCGIWGISIDIDHPDDINPGPLIVWGWGYLDCDSGTPRIQFNQLHTNVPNAVPAYVQAEAYDDTCTGGSGSGGGGDCVEVTGVEWLEALDCADGTAACTQTAQISGATGAFATMPALIGLTYHSEGAFMGLWVSNDLGIDVTPVHLVMTKSFGVPRFFLHDETGLVIASDMEFQLSVTCTPENSGSPGVEWVIDGIVTNNAGDYQGSFNILIEGS